MRRVYPHSILGLIPKRFTALAVQQWDARYFQIISLSLLLLLVVGMRGLSMSPWQLPFSLVGALSAQWLASVWLTLKFDWRSPLITALSLVLLLRMQDPLWALVAAAAAIGMKFLLRVRGQHVFNPANGIIVVLLLLGAPVWVSPGQWGASVYWMFAFILLGAWVLNQTRQLDIAISFLLTYGGLLLARAVYLGDPMAIPLHQLQSGALLLFAFFMISDPKTIPRAWQQRALFAITVALLGFYLQFFWYVREAVFYALFFTSLLYAAVRADLATWLSLTFLSRSTGR